MLIKITPNDAGNPPGKLADAELHFGSNDGSLDGLKLIGFSVWERRGGGGRHVTFPARSYAVNGERRSFALLRPIVDTTAQNAIRDRIIEAYAEYEARVTPGVTHDDEARPAAVPDTPLADALKGGNGRSRKRKSRAA